MHKIITLSVGPLETNCFMFQLTDGATLYIVDPGGDSERIITQAKSFNFSKVEILLTHAHFDHIGAVGAVSRAFNAVIKMSPKDLPIYQSPQNCMEPWVSRITDLPEEVEPAVDCADYKVLNLPGHTPGGCGYYFVSEKAVFVGDTIFFDSIGRYDFPGGNKERLFDSIYTVLMALDDSVKLYCGHGPETTVGRERKNNPYL